MEHLKEIERLQERERRLVRKNTQKGNEIFKLRKTIEDMKLSHQIEVEFLITQISILNDKQ